jgi:hypothetical protein
MRVVPQLDPIQRVVIVVPPLHFHCFLLNKQLSVSCVAHAICIAVCLGFYYTTHSTRLVGDDPNRRRSEFNLQSSIPLAMVVTVRTVVLSLHE